MNQIDLPEPKHEGTLSVESALFKRRSIREYKKGALTLEQLSTLLWAAQGITAIGGYRTAPSAGALYPLELFVVAGDVEGLKPGLYRYRTASNSLESMDDEDVRSTLSDASLKQFWMEPAPAMIVIAAVYERTTGKYGRRGNQYVHMEAGHAAQNICLEATALDLGTTVVGAFDDEKVKTIMKMKAEEYPLCILPVGRK